MFCPNCGARAADSDVFCGSCGAELRGAGEAPQAVPTRQMPPARGMQASPRSNSLGLKIAIVAGVIAILLALAGGIVAALLLRDGDEPPAVTPVQTPEDTSVTSVPPSGGPHFTAPEDALMAAVPEDWVYRLNADTPEMKEYWVGPPASEFVDVYLVERTIDGGWAVTETYPLEMGDVPVVDEEQVQYLVEGFLRAIMEDRPVDAQALTTEPFSDDPASAAYSNGEFAGFTIDGIEAQGDGTYWVLTSEDWHGNTETYRYHVVQTETGWRIRDAAVR